jgi:hypothetical protein
MIENIKVRPTHTQRAALVYVRQSTASQVEHNRESTDRQYALVGRHRNSDREPETHPEQRSEDRPVDHRIDRPPKTARGRLALPPPSCQRFEGIAGRGLTWTWPVCR